MYMKHAHGAMRKNSHAIEKKPTGVKSQNNCQSCTREFAVNHVADKPLRKVLISLKPWHAQSSRVIGAVRIALERAEVQKPIPRTSIERVEEGCVDSKDAEDLSQHLTCTRHVLMAPCAEIPMLLGKSPRVTHGCEKSQKSMHP